MTDMKPCRVGVVVQTHWDREWYFTREQFVARLLRVMERVSGQLENGGLREFLFDGQVVALDDLLAHGEPALCERVLRLVRDGRIVLGPWYVMVDEFLCAGESLWRNLEIGMTAAQAHGNCQRVGYLPDSFGHIAQMPQLLRHFSIDSAVLWRGIDAPHSELDWQGPDGSQVGTLFLTQGYYQHPFNDANWQAAVARYLALIAPRALSPHLLMTQGGDHLLPHARLAERMAEFNAGQTGCTLVQEGLAAHTERVLAATAGRRLTVSGELRANAQAFVLPDVLSTRRYLKLAHQALEDRLLGEIEPLFAQLEVPLPVRALDQCWRSLIQQQAHDSICGCSADAVHREMMSRFEQLGQRLDGLRAQALAAAGMTGELMAEARDTAAPSPFADDRLFTLFNPQPRRRDGGHGVALFLAGDAAADLSITDTSGAVVPSTLLAVRPEREFHSPLDDFPDPVAGHCYELVLDGALAGLQVRALRVAKCDGAPATEPLTAIAQRHYRVALDGEGQLRIGSAAGEQTLWIESELDAGDSYNFSPPVDRARRRHTRFELLSARRVGAVQEMLLAVSAALPAGLNAERSGPSADEVHCHGRLRLRLSDGSRFIDAQLDWTNQARDQRTRLVLPLATSVDETWSDGGFAWQRRPVVVADYPAEPTPQREMPVAVNPSYSAMAAGSVQIAHRALQEFEILQDEGPDQGCQALAITLVRSIGWLSRRDLRTRGGGAGPDIAVPDAQCLGAQRYDFKLGLLPDTDHLALLHEAAALRQPPLLLRGHSSAWRAPLQVDNPALQVSAWRRVGEQRELRVWNATGQPQPLAADGLAASTVPPFGIVNVRVAR